MHTLTPDQLKLLEGALEILTIEQVHQIASRLQEVIGVGFGDVTIRVENHCAKFIIITSSERFVFKEAQRLNGT